MGSLRLHATSKVAQYSLPFSTGDCPASHPVHLITLFQEFVYDVAKFPFNGNGTVTWVFANGDTTGLGLHVGSSLFTLFAVLADLTLCTPTGGLPERLGY